MSRNTASSAAIFVVFQAQAWISPLLRLNNGMEESDPFPWRGILQLHLSKKFYRKFLSNGKHSKFHKAECLAPLVVIMGYSECSGLVIGTVAPRVYSQKLLLMEFTQKVTNLIWVWRIVRWPISATAKLTFPRQNLLFHGKTYFFTQNLLFHGKTYFSGHGKTSFLTAKLTFSRQNLLFHGKTYFFTAKLTFPRQNFAVEK